MLANVTVIPDRIEAGSYALAALATNGQVKLKGVIKSFKSIDKQMTLIGADITEDEDGIFVKKVKKAQENIEIETKEYPGFPTDMQAQFCAFLASEGANAKISERIWENRFMHIQELNRMGANITVSDNTASIASVKDLSGAEVSATDLRASMALIIAALAAKGKL